MNRQLFEYHPTFGYRFIPELKARVEHESGGFLVRTNNQGFRCEHPFDGPQRDPTRRALLFGDSFTAGDGVSNKYRYGDQLERLVDDLEVWNYGLPGSGTDQQYLVFKELTKNVEHDIVILAVLVENIRRVAARYRVTQTAQGETQCQAKPYYTLEGGQLTLHQVPVPREPLPAAELPSEQIDHGGRLPWLRAALNRLGPSVKGLAQRVSQYDPVPAYSDPAHPDWRLMSALLTRWIGEATRPVVLMPIPLYQHVEGTASADAYRTRFRDLANATGAVLHDPMDDLNAYALEDRRKFRFENDVHPTPAWHQALAESLAPTLGANLPSRPTT